MNFFIIRILLRVIVAAVTLHNAITNVICKITYK
uniref:Uncharacterized protein n=1 Tax=Siphoviridae sp. ctZd434 TaxID=2825559 RepID=A0A8S5UHK6_9CAUD|nr:MAG TPA: hypothetical protein [Siphoviridae sp. ctZd434]